MRHNNRRTVIWPIIHVKDCQFEEMIHELSPFENSIKWFFNARLFQNFALKKLLVGQQFLGIHSVSMWSCQKNHSRKVATLRLMTVIVKFSNKVTQSNGRGVEVFQAHYSVISFFTTPRRWADILRWPAETPHREGPHRRRCVKGVQTLSKIGNRPTLLQVADGHRSFFDGRCMAPARSIARPYICVCARVCACVSVTVIGVNNETEPLKYPLIKKKWLCYLLPSDLDSLARWTIGRKYL